MKNLLLTLSSSTFLTLSSGLSSYVINNDDKNFNLLNRSNLSDNQSLFSNYYGALDSKSWWITNQSTSDQKFYSYDLEHANYLLSDKKTHAYSLFSVDSKGSLQFNTTGLTDNDIASLENTKTEIQQYKQVTTINSSYNPYSHSVYSKQYFSGNDDWQYIQLSGNQKTINISSETNASKVTHYTDLSESLGFYYIAKAVIENKIDEAVADSLAVAFVDRSTLATDFNKNPELIRQIIKLIVHNNNIYNLIFNMPFNNNDRNYSLNFIFDKDNNLIEIYYNKWDKSQIINTMNYSWNHEYGIVGPKSDSSNQNILIANWNQYANSWTEFASFFPTFFSWAGSNFEISSGSDYRSYSSLDFKKTSDISTNKSSFLHLSLYIPDHSEYPTPTSVNFDLDIWRDDTNIYYQWFLNIVGPDAISLNIIFGTVDFSN